jgi:hypothetical protein
MKTPGLDITKTHAQRVFDFTDEVVNHYTKYIEPELVEAALKIIRDYILKKDKESSIGK